MIMHTFCSTHAMPYKTRVDLRHEPPADFMRICFANPAHTDAFLTEFGGERITGGLARRRSLSALHLILRA